MDSANILEATGECSSSESGWTTYIASPDRENDPSDDEDEDEDEKDGSTGGVRQSHRKDATEVAEDVDSDDSMASDASSGPSDLYGHVGRNRHARKNDERKYAGKKHYQQEEKEKHHQQIKSEKDKSGNRADCAGRSKKA